jgi:hypothetical protein
MTRTEMMQRMPAREFDRWKDFSAVRPFGETADYIRTAQIVTMLAEINRNRKEYPTPFALGDFLLFADRPDPESVIPENEAIDDKIVAVLSTLGGG